jgi:hypothetical protein
MAHPSSQTTHAGAGLMSLALSAPTASGNQIHNNGRTQTATSPDLQPIAAIIDATTIDAARERHSPTPSSNPVASNDSE